MPGSIPVRCDACGGTFRFPPDKASQRVPCPKCRTLLDIPDEDELRSAAVNVDLVEAPAPEARLTMRCRCGKVFSAPESTRGTEVACPACGRTHTVPVEDASQGAATPESPLSWKPWIPAAIAPLVAGIGAWFAGGLGPAVIAEDLDWTLPDEFASLGRLAAGGAAVIWLALAILPALFLFRVEAARPGLMLASGLAAIAAGFPLTTVGLAIGALLAGVAFLFHSGWSVDYLEGKTPPKNIAAALAGTAILISALAGYVRWKEADRHVTDLRDLARLHTSIEPLARTIANTEPTEPDAAKTVGAALKQLDALAGEIDPFRGRVPEGASLETAAALALARLDAHRIVPLSTGAVRSLRDQLGAIAADLRRCATPPGSTRAARLTRLADTLERTAKRAE